MDFDAMVEELANRVIAAMAEIEAEQKPAEACSTTGFCYADTPESKKPILIGLTQDQCAASLPFHSVRKCQSKRKIPYSMCAEM